MSHLENRELVVYAQYLALFVVFLVGVGVPIAVRRSKSQRSKGWPVAVGVFVDGNVICSPITQYRYPKVKINFSYSADSTGTTKRASTRSTKRRICWKASRMGGCSFATILAIGRNTYWIPIETYANRAITLRPAAPKRIAASC